LNFSNFFENRDLTRLAPEKCKYLGIGPMDFGSKTGHLETSLNSTQTVQTLNYDWMSKSLPKKPPKSTEGENVVTWLTKDLAKN
jgi:hypothetical protein